ncbi:peptide/nickel transport system permease protein [Neorhizobium galegae]|uniref:ABC transporter permease n=1 Tax=Neorhizobium galegae TaxID=399 RepID=UPI0027866E0B|nr:ABC transporter permease [Neorhizobium galegae]MDQ0137762.1 peptide/nickel transport system permease protein [Neorhizobium galegae]
MLKLVVQRILSAMPVLLMVAICVFALFQLIPIDAPAVILGEGATPEAMARLAEEMGLNRPAPVIFLEWVSGTVKGDLGISYITRSPVMDELVDRLPITLTLATGGILVAISLGIPVGVMAALNRNSVLDRFLTSVVSLLLAMPAFWLALLLSLYFAVRLRWLPVSGYTPFGDDPKAWFMGFILPWLSLGFGATASIARHARSAMIEQLDSSYVRSLVARGCPSFKLVFRYCLKNAMIPVLAVIGMLTTLMLSGSLVIERVFALPGIGILIQNSLQSGDVPVLQAVVLVIAGFVILVNLCVDILYGLLDPKVRPQ